MVDVGYQRPLGYLVHPRIRRSKTPIEASRIQDSIMRNSYPHQLGLLLSSLFILGCASTNLESVSIATAPPETRMSVDPSASEGSHSCAKQGRRCRASGPCEAGASCTTRSRRCECVPTRRCSGVGPWRFMRPQPRWRCQDIRCPSDLPAAIGRGENRCRHEGLVCGQSPGPGCGATSYICRGGQWEVRMSPPAPSAER